MTAKRPLKIAIASGGRFHVLDLARELASQGHDVRFYSYVPKARGRRFGLGEQYQVSLLAFVLPLLVWERLAHGVAPGLRERWLNFLLNRAVMFRLRPCDVLICMSGIYLEAALYAKRRFGARIWVERGSQHILAQDEILAALPGAQRPSNYTTRRELAGYQLADRIVVPSSHAADSFNADPAAYAKLFRDPYGVDLAMFASQPARRECGAFTVLFVGAWSLRKGCDVLAAAVERNAGAGLLHVGGRIDLDYPEAGEHFSHRDAVPQDKLSLIYAATDVLVLPSREDGFGLVMAQALACGLPVICSDRTGGADLAHTPALADRICVVPAGDVDALAVAISTVRDRLRGGRLPSLAESDLQTLSWAAYGRRYADELCRDLAAT